MIISIIIIISFIYFVGGYALREGIRREKYKKFIKNMEKYDNKKEN